MRVRNADSFGPGNGINSDAPDAYEAANSLAITVTGQRYRLLIALLKSRMKIPKQSLIPQGIKQVCPGTSIGLFNKLCCRQRSEFDQRRGETAGKTFAVVRTVAVVGHAAKCTQLTLSVFSYPFFDFLTRRIGADACQGPCAVQRYESGHRR